MPRSLPLSIPRARAFAAAWLTAAVLGTAACSDDAGDPDDSAAAPSSTASSSSASPPSESASESSSASAEPSAGGVAPATGPLISVGTSSFHAPEGWEFEEGITTEQVSAFRPGGGGLITLGEFQSLGGPTPLEIQVQSAQEVLPDNARVQRLPDVELGDDGTLAGHLTYTLPGEDVVSDVVVTERGGQSITLDFDLEPSDLRQNPDIVASVLASWVWVAGGSA